MNVGYHVDHKRHPQNNTIIFKSCSFEKNSAIMGGGVAIFSGVSNLPNSLFFRQCNWTENVAEVGSALRISSVVWKAFEYDIDTNIEFTDCRFVSNHLQTNIHNIKLNKSYKKGGGAFFAVGYHILFRGDVLFRDNTGSAMHLISTKIEFCSGSNIYFTSNSQALYGGAIYMLGFASIVLNHDVNATFSNNTAVVAGGAIYQNSFDIRDYFASQNCFIKYNINMTDVEGSKIALVFENNSIIGSGVHQRNIFSGHTIFTSTLVPCLNSSSTSNVSDTCNLKFIFKNGRKMHDISTYSRKTDSELEMNETVPAVPGKRFQLAIVTLDDTDEEVQSDYWVSVYNSSNVRADSPSVKDKFIRFYGKPGDVADIVLESVHIRKILFKFRVKLQQCPPGFVFVDGNDGKCVCSFGKFLGIQSCDEEEFQAFLHSKYWVGYDINNSTFGREENLLQAICPSDHCLSNEQKINFTIRDPIPIHNKNILERQ